VFTTGVLSPKIYLSQALSAVLDADELRAVLYHERHHVRHRHPLLKAAITVAADTLFWVPLVRTLTERLIIRMEFAADDAAIKESRRPLASALVKSFRQAGEMRKEWGLATCGLAVSGLVDLRVQRLLSECARKNCLPRTPRLVFLISAAAVMMLWFFGVTSAASHASHGIGGVTVESASMVPGGVVGNGCG